MCAVVFSAQAGVDGENIISVGNKFLGELSVIQIDLLQ
jgi:hypothetical protein